MPANPTAGYYPAARRAVLRQPILDRTLEKRGWLRGGSIRKRSNWPQGGAECKAVPGKSRWGAHKKRGSLPAKTTTEHNRQPEGSGRAYSAYSIQRGWRQD